MDTSWLLSPPAFTQVINGQSVIQLPVVIYLTFWINDTIFDASTDVSNIKHNNN
jgi:hypothetical protein